MDDNTDELYMVYDGAKYVGYCCSKLEWAQEKAKSMKLKEPHIYRVGKEEA